MWSFIKVALCLLPFASAAPAVGKRADPVVELEFAKVVGSSLAGIDSFKGIPYALPPVGKLRLKPPQPITSNIGTIQAVGEPRSCPQFITSTDTSVLPLDVLAKLLNTPLFQAASNSGEDCLTINVQRPSTTTLGSKLPVVFWIYGGAFALGSTQTYDASELISTSVAQGKGIVYVSVNYRLGGFGFMPGKEILKDGSANIGLLDQRLGLQWVADNIAKFGGDPDKVTIWGESAGSISVFDQMALYGGNNTYKGKPLFRGGIMDSGSVIPADPVDTAKGQAVYNKVVAEAGCSAAADTLECLRDADYTTFLNAANSLPGILSYSSVALSYLPRPDGKVLTDSPEALASTGKYAKVPFIIGDQEDEGTIFSLFQGNVTTTAELVSYFKTILFPNVSIAEIQGLIDTYPDNPSAGSPFNTGIFNNIYPQYKRIAAIFGDLLFTLSRRVLLQIAANVNPSVPTWSYLSSYNYGTPIVGTFHASDISQVYGITPGIPSSTIQAYYISFINTLDPNEGTTGLIEWPQWSGEQTLLQFYALGTKVAKDDFRSDSYNYLLQHGGTFRV
ncbi:cholinesterase [Bisporella sp. PMI_857]|nr:cholinesterase [Bisporella sp. PMI_857]